MKINKYIKVTIISTLLSIISIFFLILKLVSSNTSVDVLAGFELNHFDNNGIEYSGSRNIKLGDLNLKIIREITSKGNGSIRIENKKYQGFFMTDSTNNAEENGDKTRVINDFLVGCKIFYRDKKIYLKIEMYRTMEEGNWKVMKLLDLGKIGKDLHYDSYEFEIMKLYEYSYENKKWLLKIEKNELTNFIKH